MCAGRKVLPRDLLARKIEGNFGDRHERVTLRKKCGRGALLGHSKDTTTELVSAATPNYPRNEKSLGNTIDATLSLLSLTSQYPLNAGPRHADIDQGP
jgi:hypothetical protein